ncbi:MAG: DUF6492 family protein [Isosphaeraceae bacterium]|nr:DUF6492 family protein [Isosphaeraceae bacterium]
MKLTIVTPSYRNDLERCELLCRSVDRFASSELGHVVVVDRRDVARFRHLAGPRREIVAVEDVLPRWILRAPLTRGWWLSLKTPPIRNWILQQIVKLSIGEAIDAGGYVFVDSDVALVRPLMPGAFVRDGRLALFRVPARYAVADRWHRVSARLLGLPETDFFGANYVGNLITWRRDILRRLHRRIESATGMPWIRAVARQVHFSEYTLYGLFVDHALDADSGHFPDDRNLCDAIWNGPWGTAEDIQRLFLTLGPESVAVMISSKIGVPASRYSGSWDAFSSGIACVRMQ